MTKRPRWIVLPTAYCLLLTAGMGCESLQRKFVRKPKHPAPLPSPIITFQDYTRAMTPLDRYRKHYLMFDYWNDELLEALTGNTPSLKRLKRASTEALGELETMRELVADDRAASLEPLIEERAKIDRQLQHGHLSWSQTTAVSRVLEAQTRQIQREFFWREVEDHLRPDESEDVKR